MTYIIKISGITVLLNTEIKCNFVEMAGGGRVSQHKQTSQISSIGNRYV